MNLKTGSKIIFLAILAISLTPAAVAEEIKLVASVPYSEGHDVRQKVINECVNLGSKLSSFTQSFAKKRGIDVQLVDTVSTASQGRVLQLEISDAVSQGNAFIGHRKFVEIKGSLWENGEKIAAFEGQRSSGGGFGAGYKSSCAVLGRCVKTLGKDIAAWLDNPKDGASIGE